MSSESLPSSRQLCPLARHPHVDRWESSIEAIVGIAVTRRNLADATVLRLTPAHHAAIAALPDECIELIQAQGAAEAWAAAVELLRQHLARRRA